MALTIEGNRFHCTTTDTTFGPWWKDPNDAYRFWEWLAEQDFEGDDGRPIRDPRQLKDIELQERIIEWAITEGGMVKPTTFLGPHAHIVAAVAGLMEVLDDLENRVRALEQEAPV